MTLFLNKFKGFLSWFLSLAVIGAILSFIRRGWFLVVARRSEKRLKEDSSELRRRVELVETEWDRVGKRVDELRKKN